MLRRNRSAVCDVLDAIERRDWTRLQRLLHPDIHWTTAVGRPNRIKVTVGRPSLGAEGVSPRIQVRVDATLAAALRSRARGEALRE